MKPTDITGLYLWNHILRKLVPEHDYNYFKLQNGQWRDINHAITPTRAIRIAISCLGDQKIVYRQYQPVVPVALRKELEKKFHFTGRCNGPNAESMQTKAGELLGSKIEVLMRAADYKIKKAPVYTGRRKQIDLKLTKKQLVVLKILARYLGLYEWQLITLLLGGESMYTPKLCKSKKKLRPTG